MINNVDVGAHDDNSGGVDVDDDKVGGGYSSSTLLAAHSLTRSLILLTMIMPW